MVNIMDNLRVSQVASVNANQFEIDPRAKAQRQLSESEITNAQVFLSLLKTSMDQVTQTVALDKKDLLKDQDEEEGQEEENP